MKVIPIYIEAGISGFESPAAEYKELGLSLDKLPDLQRLTMIRLQAQRRFATRCGIKRARQRLWREQSTEVKPLTTNEIAIPDVSDGTIWDR